MKPVTPDCMVFYSASSCLFYDSEHSFHQIDTLLNEKNEKVDTTQLAQIQLQLDGSRLEQKQFALIVVPDTWLSISEHTLDHVVPKQLAPLAALAFAVESTFSSPDTLWFRYQMRRAHKTSQMQVMACTQSLAEQVCQPFHNRGMRYRLICAQQWEAMKGKPLCLWRLAQQGLAPFDPELGKRRHYRAMWAGFLAACLLLQLGLLMHSNRLTDEEAALDRRLEVVHLGEHDEGKIHEKRLFLQQVLHKTQALPAFVRLSSFKGDGNTAYLQLSLPAYQVKPLLARWHQEEPSWHFSIDQTPQNQDAMDRKKEVMNVAVSISSI